MTDLQIAFLNEHHIFELYDDFVYAYNYRYYQFQIIILYDYLYDSYRYHQFQINFPMSRGRQICRFYSKLFKFSLTKSLWRVMSSAHVFSWFHERVKSSFQTVISCQLFGSLLLLCSAYRAWPRRHCYPCQTFLTKSVATRWDTKGWLEKIST